MEEDGRDDLNLNEIWRACRKIQSTIFRYGFNICAEFCPHDPKGTGLISQSIFSYVLGKYKSVIGFSDFELREVMDYFRVRDGRVNYRQFCKVVCKEVHDKGAKQDIATGLEWNDPMYVNILPQPEDRRRLCLILIKIAQSSHLPLLPYFQDYEIVSANVGTVTVSHFSRVLHFMKIPVTDEDFLLLLKRYMKDSYMVNYVAFIKHIQNIIDYLKERNLTDKALHIIHDFPGRLVDLELPQLPPIDGSQLVYKIFPDSCNHPKDRNDCELVFCIQNYIYKNRVRVREFLEGFDHYNTGTITLNQFERALHNMGLGKAISQRDFKVLSQRYLDPIDTNRIMWRAFEDEIDSVFTIKRLEKMPQLEVQSPPPHIEQMPRPGSLEWGETKPEMRDLCENTLVKIQMRIRNRRLHLQPFFRNYDRLSSGHVRCNQANQVFLTNGILLTNNELNALLGRYGNELGFNYKQFLEDADPAEYAIPKLREQATLHAECEEVKEDKVDRDSEEYIIKVLSKAKRQVVTRSIAVMEFLQDYDRHREGEILEVDFRRGLDNANIKLTVEEVDTMCEIFRSPKRACCVLYRDFVKAVDELFIKIDMQTGDNEVTAVPLMHLANLDCLNCFLNFEERTVCSHALMKLARKPDEISNLSAVFKDFDRENCGTIRRNQLLRALTVRDMHYMISSREFDAICKCFGVERGLDLEFNYRDFLNVLNILFQTGQVKRNY